MLEKLRLFCLTRTDPSIFTSATPVLFVDVKMDGSVLKEKSPSKILGSIFSSKLDWDFYIISVAKSASKKIGALICSMKFLSPSLLSISINLPYSHTWNTVVMFWLVLLVATCSDASRCILVPFEWYGCPKKCVQKSSCSTFSIYIYHIKTKQNIVYEYLKTKIFSGDTNILPQMHLISINTQLQTLGVLGYHWIIQSLPSRKQYAQKTSGGSLGIVG